MNFHLFHKIFPCCNKFLIVFSFSSQIFLEPLETIFNSFYDFWCGLSPVSPIAYPTSHVYKLIFYTLILFNICRVIESFLDLCEIVLIIVISINPTTIKTTLDISKKPKSFEKFCQKPNKNLLSIDNKDVFWALTLREFLWIADFAIIWAGNQKWKATNEFSARYSVKIRCHLFHP